MNVQFVPELDGVVSLFSRAATAASLYVHLLCINLFTARWLMFDGGPPAHHIPRADMIYAVLQHNFTLS